MTISVEWETTPIDKQLDYCDPIGWHAVHAQCPAPSCRKRFIRLQRKVFEEWAEENGRLVPIPPSTVVSTDFLAYPRRRNRPEIDSESLPQTLKNDYLEACGVLELSPKASAVLSRRVLQGVLREQGYASKNLYTQIQAVLDEEGEKALPTSIKDTIDYVRRFGNFSAHPDARPITEETTLQVIDIEEGEAEWCLEIIEELFTHYYVEPDRRTRRIQAAEEKLAERESS